MMAFTNIIVVGSFQDALGKTVNGIVEATPSVAITNANKTVTVVSVKGRIENGKLKMTIVANDDAETLPVGSFYTFKVIPYRGTSYEFKVVVKHTVGEQNIAKLLEESGQIGVPTTLRPKLLGNANHIQIIEALGNLGLVEVISVPPGSPTFNPDG